MTQIQIWHASCSIDDVGPMEVACERYLDTEERGRADRFRQATSRNQHVVGRGMAKHLLAQQSGIDPAAIRFDLLPHGKPIVREPKTAACPFNVAHTQGLVLCGITDSELSCNDPGSPDEKSLDQTSLLGVDVENLTRRTDTAIADRFFSKPEVAFLHRFTDEAERKRMFLRIWTLKESFIKAIGTGMSTPLADFAFEQIDSRQPTISMLDPKLDTGAVWYFEVFEPKPGYVGAVAFSSSNRPVRPEVIVTCFDGQIGG